MTLKSEREDLGNCLDLVGKGNEYLQLRVNIKSANELDSSGEEINHMYITYFSYGFKLAVIDG
ncbi:MAG: hypothetical protein A4E48_00410 [Methanosaeta sp. PtaU1.Bin060]|nr:MAG: hypothetical protein A4E48_00410 [Methanosaeta sp. PtaU1.Bin060]